MPIISAEIMKIIDEREMQKKKEKKKTKTEKNKGDKSYSERMRAKWFCCAFKFKFLLCVKGFLQLICKTCIIFKLNLVLTLSIILKERELHESKNVVVECKCLKIWDLCPVWYVPQS